MLKLRLWDYSDGYILVKETVKVNGQRSDDTGSFKVIFKSCVPYTDCMSKINNTQKNNVKDLELQCQCII